MRKIWRCLSCNEKTVLKIYRKIWDLHMKFIETHFIQHTKALWSSKWSSPLCIDKPRLDIMNVQMVLFRQMMLSADLPSFKEYISISEAKE